MPVKYLSQEWIDAYNAAMADDAVRGAVKGKSATIQMVVSDAPTGGEVHYWLRIADGDVTAGLGDLDGAEVTIRQSYETSAQVNRGELDGQKAFTQGKVKIVGQMMKMMQLRGPLAQVQTALAAIDTAY
jgi:putative sterol carrier protein